MPRRVEQCQIMVGPTHTHTHTQAHTADWFRSIASAALRKGVCECQKQCGLDHDVSAMLHYTNARYSYSTSVSEILCRAYLQINYRRGAQIHCPKHFSTCQPYRTKKARATSKNMHFTWPCRGVLHLGTSSWHSGSLARHGTKLFFFGCWFSQCAFRLASLSCWHSCRLPQHGLPRLHMGRSMNAYIAIVYLVTMHGSWASVYDPVPCSKKFIVQHRMHFPLEKKKKNPRSPCKSCGKTA